MGGLRIRFGAQAPTPISIAIARAQLALTGRAVGLSLLPFIDTFPVDLNPLSTSVYTQGATVGLDWFNMKCAGGLAYTTTRTPDADTVDGLALYKNGLINTAKHYAKITAHLAGGYTAANSHEIEAHVFADITANVARGYEMDWPQGNGLSAVRWNGSKGNFTVFGSGWGTTISGTRPTTPLANGDVFLIKGEVVAGNPRMSMYINDLANSVWVIEDQTAGKWTTGCPGMGSFIRLQVSLADMDKWSISRFEAGNW